MSTQELILSTYHLEEFIAQARRSEKWGKKDLMWEIRQIRHSVAWARGAREGKQKCRIPACVDS